MPVVLTPLRIAIVLGALALATALSCKTFDLPTESCDPSNIDAQRMHGEGIDGTCSRCLEDKCCDAVGHCGNTDGCVDLVRGVHECVISAGGTAASNAEPACAASLGTIGEANSVYRCMRGSCGSECGLPVCAVTPSAALFRNDTCDICLASACCPELNACYGNRTCKLALECINRDCGPELGDALTAIHANGGASLMVSLDAGFDACDPAQYGSSGTPACVKNCLCNLKKEELGLPPEDTSSRYFIQALDVYRCAGLANCGAGCAHGLDASAR